MRLSARRLQGLVRRIAPRPVFRLCFALAHPANRGRRLSAVRQAARFELSARLLRRPMIVALGARSKIIADPNETNSPHAVYTNPPNWRQMTTWKRHLRPGDLFVDVGGNIGIYTIFAQDLGATTITIEPNRHNCLRIREHLALNGYVGEVHNKAAADKPGTVRITDDLDSYNHLLLHEDAGGTEVEAVTLDSVIGERVVAGLKIDVEGAERLVLEGAARALSERRIRLIQCEWSAAEVQRTLGETRAPLEALFAHHGYRLYRPDDEGRLRLVDRPVPPGRDVFASLDAL